MFLRLETLQVPQKIEKLYIYGGFLKKGENHQNGWFIWNTLLKWIIWGYRQNIHITLLNSWDSSPPSIPIHPLCFQAKDSICRIFEVDEKIYHASSFCSSPRHSGKMNVNSCQLRGTCYQIWTMAYGYTEIFSIPTKKRPQKRHRKHFTLCGCLVKTPKTSRCFCKIFLRLLSYCQMIGVST